MICSPTTRGTCPVVHTRRGTAATDPGARRRARASSTTRSQGSHRCLRLVFAGAPPMARASGVGGIRRTPGNAGGGEVADVGGAERLPWTRGLRRRGGVLQAAGGERRRAGGGTASPRAGRRRPPRRRDLGGACPAQAARGRTRNSEPLGRDPGRRRVSLGRATIGPVERERLRRVELLQEHLELGVRSAAASRTGQRLRDGRLCQHGRERPELSGRREHGSDARHQGRDRRVPDEGYAPGHRLVQRRARASRRRCGRRQADPRPARARRSGRFP